MLFDLPLEQLKQYAPPRAEPSDFSAFWGRTLETARAHPMKLELAHYAHQPATVEVFDASFPGYGGQTIKGWLLMPRQRSGKLACIVEYIGYGGGRGLPVDWLTWSAFGYAHFVMDTRGQGSLWLPGDTPDIEDLPGHPQVPGFMTRGVLSPETYFYRRVFTDAVRAIDAVRTLKEIDPSRVFATGGSQGGGITLAVAGLVPDLAGAMPDVPFLCHFKTATEITDRDPYQELVRFCKIHRGKTEQVFSTLAYFDGMNLAAHARCRALFSVGLMDDICPPRTVFAAFNHYAGTKEIRVWPYNNHEGGQSDQTLEKVQWLKRAGA
ncbi:MAG: acetyl xylan esterase family protein [Bacteroidetes bacterium]|nr:acetyl xylan esterase family protein [Bacteroidota bacterium]